MVFSAEDEKSETEKRKETLLYGLDSEVAGLIDTLSSEKDKSFIKEIFFIFETTKNVNVKEKIINYYTQLEDEGLKEYALSIAEDPYDEKKSTVNLVFKYIEKMKITDAAPFLKTILESENVDYFDAAISALGSVGGVEEAVFLSEFIDKDELSLGQRQSLVKALGKLQVVETWDKLVEFAEDEDENSYIRMYSAEAIGNMKKDESVDILIKLFESTDPNLRQYVLKGLSNFTTEKVEDLVVSALKDDHYKVRTEAIEIVKDQKITKAVPYIIYRAKNDSEKSVKSAAYKALGILNTNECIDLLVEIVENEKASETLRAEVSSVILENDINRGIDVVIEVAKKSLTDDKKKNLRYALGKEFAKYKKASFSEICGLYLESKDVATQGTGLDIFKAHKYPSLKAKVEEIANSEKESSIKKKAKLILESL
jgi:HEAT repeat protein